MDILLGIQNVSTVWFQSNFRKKKGNCDFCFCKHGLKDTVSLCMLCNVVWHQGFIMNLKCQSLSCGILSLFSVITKEQFTTVPLKSKLTLKT